MLCSFQLTYQLRRTTTSCWCEWHGMDANAYGCGTDPFRRTSPGICCSKYVQPPELHCSAVRIHRIPSEHIEGSPQLLPSFFPNRRCESWDRAHHDRNAILGKACSYSNGNCNEYKKKNKINLRISSVAIVCICIPSSRSATHLEPSEIEIRNSKLNNVETLKYS